MLHGQNIDLKYEGNRAVKLRVLEIAIFEKKRRQLEAEKDN